MKIGNNIADFLEDTPKLLEKLRKKHGDKITVEGDFLPVPSPENNGTVKAIILADGKKIGNYSAKYDIDGFYNIKYNRETIKN